MRSINDQLMSLLRIILILIKLNWLKIFKTLIILIKTLINNNQ